jgi:mannose-1-phosphate guanylyltransferase
LHISKKNSTFAGLIKFNNKFRINVYDQNTNDMMKHNYCVIMAGGVGSRFWPFSRTDKPKQFLDFFGTGQSLLQMTINRFSSLVPTENILIVTNVLYRDLILEQLPMLQPSQVLCEPARRNTAPCIAYAVARIKAMTKQRGEKTANIVVAPSDHLILQEDKFVQTITDGLQFVASHDALLTLGMKPTRPDTGYGYIQIASEHMSVNNTGICKVRAFTEKPNLELAKKFVDSGEFLWNSGIFLWNLQAIDAAFSSYLPEVAQKFAAGERVLGTDAEEAFIQEIFPTCPSISIDYGVMEHAKNVYVLPSDFGWSDLGTWGSLYDLSQKDEDNNATLHCEARYYDSHGNIVTLPKGHMAVIQGLENYIVAESNGILLICKREEEQQIRQFHMDADEKWK